MAYKGGGMGGREAKTNKNHRSVLTTMKPKTKSKKKQLPTRVLHVNGS